MEFTIEFLRVFVRDLGYAAPLLISLLAVILLIGYVIGSLEGWAVSDPFYHALINATTVGYGDFRPSRAPAKVLAVVLALIGLVFTGIVVAMALHAADYAFGQIHDVTGFSRPNRG
jgi:voltage-gated potassium channel